MWSSRRVTWGRTRGRCGARTELRFLRREDGSTFPFVGIFHIQGGKIRSIRIYYDQIELFMQLGLMPGAATTGTVPGPLAFEPASARRGYRSTGAMRVAAFVAAVLVGAGLVDALIAVGASETGQPVPLAGLPLSGTSHLHLLVADNPPFVVDVDSGRVTPLRAPVAMRHGVLWVTAAAGDAGVIVAGHPKGQIYGVGARGARLIFLGRGSAVVPSSVRRSVWIKSKAGSACRLRQVALEGHQIGQASSLACSATIESAGSLGLVYSRVRVVDPLTGRTLLRHPLRRHSSGGKPPRVGRAGEKIHAARHRDGLSEEAGVAECPYRA